MNKTPFDEDLPGDENDEDAAYWDDADAGDEADVEQQPAPAQASYRSSFWDGNWNLGTIDLSGDAGEGCLFALGIGLAVVLMALLVKGIRKLIGATTDDKRMAWGLVVVGSGLLLFGLIFVFAHAVLACQSGC